MSKLIKSTSIILLKLFDINCKKVFNQRLINKFTKFSKRKKNNNKKESKILLKINKKKIRKKIQKKELLLLHKYKVQFLMSFFILKVLF
jgi:hypothetical protein